ncbi:MAG TPA: MFS transporter [Holophaga sp.]|nr:MFS transporter [Holophaga sp.]
MGVHPEAGRWHERRWALLALTSVGAFMAPLDGSIVAVALPKMGPALHLSFGASLWVQAAYLLTMAVLLIPLGRLADQRGRMGFYLAGIGVFTLGSLAAALSVNGWTLILSRIVQAAGGALLSATSTAIVTAVFPPSERGRALGINVMAVYAGLSVGPPLGGFLVDHLGWPWIFLVNLPVGAAVLAWGWWLRPPREARIQGRRGDLPGTCMSGLGLLCLLVPLTFGSRWGWTAPPTWGLLAASALCFWAFLKAETRAASPLLDLELLRGNRLFAMANLAALLNYMALYGISILTAIHLQLVQGHPARVTGWIMLCQPLMQSSLSPLAGRLSDRMGSRLLSTAGMVATAGGMLLLACMGQGASIVRATVSLAVVGVGMAAFSAPNTSAVMGSVGPARLSVASAFLGTMRVVGQALSIAILGGIAASQLSAAEWQQLLQRHGSSGATEAFARGYSAAMVTGALLALLGAWASLTRGAAKHG